MLFPDTHEPKILLPERDLRLPRADWREPRDWRRPWLDKPGFSGCCCTHTCAACSLPDILHATFSNSGKCSGLDGKSFALTWQASTTASNLSCVAGSFAGWRLLVTDSNSCIWEMIVVCVSGGGNNFMNFCLNDNAHVNKASAQSAAFSCSPLSVPITLVIPTGYCGACSVSGSWTVTVTL